MQEVGLRSKGMDYGGQRQVVVVPSKKSLLPNLGMVLLADGCQLLRESISSATVLMGSTLPGRPHTVMRDMEQPCKSTGQDILQSSMCLCMCVAKAALQPGFSFCPV